MKAKMYLTMHCGLLWLMLATSPVILTQGAKILLMPGDHHAHVAFFSRAGKILQEGGHHVSVVTHKARRETVEKQNITSIFSVDLPTELQTGGIFEKIKIKLFEGRLTDIPSILQTVKEGMTQQFEYMFSQQELWNDLEESSFDLVIVDSDELHRSFYIVPYKLGIPYISLSERYDPWGLGISAMPSVEPPWSLIYFDTKASSFLDRVKSLFLYSLLHVILPPSMDESMITKYAPDKPKTTFQDLYMNSELWLISTEHTCLDTPRVSGPHVKFIEGLSDQSAEPLSAHLEDVMKTAEHGVILSSFGSVIEEAPQDIMQKMMTAFSQISFQIVMKSGGENPSNVPGNVHFENWLPQNDILGHEKTILFITHGGVNGQIEALYQGVPMLIMPFGMDQTYNADRAAHRGYARILNPYDFTPEQLLAEITELTNNSTYKENIQRCSQIHRQLARPGDDLRHIVDHVVQFGGKHLHPGHLGQPAWKLLMLDVLAVLILVCWLLCKLGVWVIRFICCRKSETTYAKQKTN